MMIQLIAIFEVVIHIALFWCLFRVLMQQDEQLFELRRMFNQLSEYYHDEVRVLREENGNILQDFRCCRNELSLLRDECNGVKKSACKNVDNKNLRKKDSDS